MVWWLLFALLLVCIAGLIGSLPAAVAAIQEWDPLKEDSARAATTTEPVLSDDEGTYLGGAYAELGRTPAGALLDLRHPLQRRADRRKAEAVAAQIRSIHVGRAGRGDDFAA